VATLEHPPSSPDLAAADFYLFPGLKSVLKGKNFCDDTEIIRNVTEELKRLSQNGFQECFQHFYGRWQKYLHKGAILAEMYLKYLYRYHVFLYRKLHLS
jgi:hypothetical protein